MWYNPSFKKSKSGQIPAGRTVLIPSAGALAGARDVPDPAIEKYGSSRRRAVTHVVKQGETLAGLAQRYGTSVSALKRYNGLKATAIYPGQVLVVKPSSAAKKKKK